MDAPFIRNHYDYCGGKNGRAEESPVALTTDHVLSEREGLSLIRFSSVSPKRLQTKCHIFYSLFGCHSEKIRKITCFCEANF